MIHSSPASGSRSPRSRRHRDRRIWPTPIISSSGGATSRRWRTAGWNWAGVEPIKSRDRFWFWDDAETILAYHPDGRSRETPEQPNQRRFRERLLREYGGRCAVTGCDAPEMLDAAHLTP